MSTKTKTADSDKTVAEVSIVQIALSNLWPFQKHVFSDKSEDELGRMSDSIKEMGVIQPIVVRPNKNIMGNYEIICGHSRVEAAKLAGLTEIDAIIREMSDDEAVIMAIESNIEQRSFKN